MTDSRGITIAGASNDANAKNCVDRVERLDTTPEADANVRADMKLNINDSVHEVEASPDMPLLWVLRDVVGLTGTKYGCGMAQCGACTVHLDGHPVRSCVTPASTVGNRKITTIEGLSKTGLHVVQQAWTQADVVQCGYCQSGQIMAAAALLAGKPDPTDSDIDAALSGNVCRCGTYLRVREAIHLAARLGRGGK